MLQGRNMQNRYTGMRKGISLVEILIAIVIFGVLATISYNYYKTYYDTSFAAKQTRIYVVIDQAAQLSNAFDLYNTKNGADPVDIQAMVDDRILTDIPGKQPFVSNTGWTLEDNKTIAGVTASNDVVFEMKLDSAVSSTADALDYCNILNNTADSNWSVDPSTSNLAAQGTIATRWADGNTSVTNQMEFFHCADQLGDGNLTLIFVKRVDLL